VFAPNSFSLNYSLTKIYTYTFLLQRHSEINFRVLFGLCEYENGVPVIAGLLHAKKTMQTM